MEVVSDAILNFRGRCSGGAPAAPGVVSGPLVGWRMGAREGTPLACLLHISPSSGPASFTHWTDWPLLRMVSALMCSIKGVSSVILSTHYSESCWKIDTWCRYAGAGRESINHLLAWPTPSPTNEHLDPWFSSQITLGNSAVCIPFLGVS